MTQEDCMCQLPGVRSFRAHDYKKMVNSTLRTFICRDIRDIKPPHCRAGARWGLGYLYTSWNPLANFVLFCMFTLLPMIQAVIFLLLLVGYTAWTNIIDRRGKQIANVLLRQKMHDTVSDNCQVLGKCQPSYFWFCDFCQLSNWFLLFSYIPLWTLRRKIHLMWCGPGIFFVGRIFNYKFSLFNRYWGIQVICFFLSETWWVVHFKELVYFI